MDAELGKEVGMVSGQIFEDKTKSESKVPEALETAIEGLRREAYHKGFADAKALLLSVEAPKGPSAAPDYGNTSNQILAHDWALQQKQATIQGQQHTIEDLRIQYSTLSAGHMARGEMIQKLEQKLRLKQEGHSAECKQYCVIIQGQKEELTRVQEALRYSPREQEKTAEAYHKLLKELSALTTSYKVPPA